jgi:DNA-binding transcriptional ArsR family regulator
LADSVVVGMTNSQCGQRQVTTDRLLKALAHQDRRTILAELSAHDSATISVDTLSDRAESVPGPELYHRHLPVLAEAGLVTFERDEEDVEYTPNERADAILAVVDDRFE